MAATFMDSDKDNEKCQKSLVDWPAQMYERAQENALHADVIAYEVAAIVWSANVLLLGFVLEVPLTPARQKPVFAAALVSLFFSVYVPYVMRLTKIGQRLAREICRDIEEKEHLPEWLRFHTRVHAIYRPRRGEFAVYAITAVFVLLWFYVGIRALACIFGS
jgi:hypothetical protein